MTAFRAKEIDIYYSETIISLEYPYMRVLGDVNVGVDLVNTPYGYFYPISGIWGNYKSILEVYINNNKLSDSDWRELTPDERDGVGTNGCGAYSGFAHAVKLLNGITVKTNDVIKMVCVKRNLHNVSIEGLRIGSTLHDPPLINEEEIHKRRGYTHPSPNNNNADRTPNNTIIWLAPYDDRFLIVLYKLPRFGAGRNRRGINVYMFSMGRCWRPYKTAEASSRYIRLNPTISFGSALAFKLAVMDKESGAISSLSPETITAHKVTQAFGTLATLMLK
ncbi:MAG: hypothetical protein ABIM30_00510 [candidate division WOR-3 bacterium]